MNCLSMNRRSMNCRSMNRYWRHALLLLPPFALAGCLKPDNPQGREAAASAPQPTIHYSVSEATVRLEHDYEGRIEPDVTQTLTLRFRHGYTSGLMRVEFYAHNGLEIYNAEAPRVLPLDAAQPLILPIELTAPAAGEYYLSIFTTVESADGEVSKRIFGLDLKAGDDWEVARKGPKIDRVRDIRQTRPLSALNFQYLPFPFANKTPCEDRARKPRRPTRTACLEPIWVS